MGIVTEPGFYDGKFLKAGQFNKPEVETAVTGVGGSSAGEKGDAAFASMSKEELLATAKERGIDVKSTDTKAEIIKALEAE